MTSTIVIIIALGLMVLCIALHRQNDLRAVYLRRASVALAIALPLREAPFTDLLAFDLAKRLALLVTVTHVSMVIGTFRTQGLPLRSARRILAGAGLVGLTQCVLAAFLPLHPDGTVVLGYQTHGSPVAVLYYLMYLLPVLLTTVVVVVACARSLFRSRQSPTVRTSLTLILLGTVCAFAYIGSAIFDLIAPRGTLGADLRQQILAWGVVLLFLGLTVGAIHRVVLEVWQRVALRIAIGIVEPLWRAVTQLEPGVVLPRNNDQHRTARMELTRQVVETHDGLTLIHGDTDLALVAIHHRHQDPAHRSAALLLHLTSSTVVYPPCRSIRILGHLLTRRDDTMGDSIRDLYNIRMALVHVARDTQGARPDTAPV